ncbi:MAG: SPOR domain-containing protein [Wenzhouxiangellaceae bacterium]
MDKVLKRRLIGASILIALAVIFVPMLLVDPDAVDGRSVSEIEIPSMPETAREVRRIPLDPDAARPAGPQAGQADPESTSGSRADVRDPRTSRREARQPEVRVEPEIVLRPQPDDRQPAPPASAPEPAAEPPPAQTELESEPAVTAEPSPSAPGVQEPTEAGQWIVQVASFGSAESADRVQQQLQALGHAVLRDEVVRGDSKLHRLRTGPYAGERQANTAIQQIRTTVDGVEPILQQVSGRDGPDAEPGFAVQVGVFVRGENAESESGRLAEIGFSAFRYSEQVGERMIWRVLVGPVPDRSAAEALKQRLADQAGVEGLVVSYP